MELILVDEAAAALYAGRPGVTIRRWAHEGRIKRYGSGRGKVRYNILELPRKTYDPWTDKEDLGEPPALPKNRAA